MPVRQPIRPPQQQPWEVGHEVHFPAGHNRRDAVLAAIKTFWPEVEYEIIHTGFFAFESKAWQEDWDLKCRTGKNGDRMIHVDFLPTVTTIVFENQKKMQPLLRAIELLLGKMTTVRTGKISVEDDD